AEATSTAREPCLASKPPPGGVAPLRGIAPEVARAEATMRILAGLDDERAPAVTDHQPGGGAQRLLARLRPPVDAPRRPLARRDQHATGLAGSDEGVRNVETVDHAVAGVVEVEDARLSRAERIRDHVGR